MKQQQLHRCSERHVTWDIVSRGVKCQRPTQSLHYYCTSRLHSVAIMTTLG